MISAVIFDLDGTLIHLPINYQKMFQEFKKIMKCDNVQPLTETVSRLDEKTRQQVFAVWDEIELEAATHLTINAEGIEIYGRYAQKPKALVTMQGEAVVKKILPDLGLSFNFVFTRENSLSRVQQLENAAEKLKVQFADILFVGNTENDEHAAKKLGCQFLKVK